MNETSAIAQIETVRNALAFLLVGAFVATIPLLVYKAIGPDSKEIVTYMIGQLSGMATTALGFYFVNKVGQDALDAKRTENSGKLIETTKSAVEAMGTASTGDSASAFKAADDVATAATDKAEEIKSGDDEPLDLSRFPTDDDPKPPSGGGGARDG